MHTENGSQLNNKPLSLGSPQHTPSVAVWTRLCHTHPETQLAKQDICIDTQISPDPDSTLKVTPTQKSDNPSTYFKSM